MLNLNEPIKVAHLQKLANQSMLNGALVKDNSFSQSQKNFGRLMSNALIEKEIEIWAVKNLFY